MRTQAVSDRPCVYPGPDGSEPIWICYPYPNGITFEHDPVWLDPMPNKSRVNGWERIQTGTDRK